MPSLSRSQVSRPGRQLSCLTRLSVASLSEVLSTMSETSIRSWTFVRASRMPGGRAYQVLLARGLLEGECASVKRGKKWGRGGGVRTDDPLHVHLSRIFRSDLRWWACV